MRLLNTILRVCFSLALAAVSPSGTDEETFARCFGSSDWALMFILARGGETYVRLALHAGPGG